MIKSLNSINYFIAIGQFSFFITWRGSWSLEGLRLLSVKQSDFEDGSLPTVRAVLPTVRECRAGFGGWRDVRGGRKAAKEKGFRGRCHTWPSSTMQFRDGPPSLHTVFCLRTCSLWPGDQRWNSSSFCIAAPRQSSGLPRTGLLHRPAFQLLLEAGQRKHLGDPAMDVTLSDLQSRAGLEPAGALAGPRSEAGSWVGSPWVSKPLARPGFPSCLQTCMNPDGCLLCWKIPAFGAVNTTRLFCMFQRHWNPMPTLVTVEVIASFCLENVTA